MAPDSTSSEFPRLPLPSEANRTESGLLQLLVQQAKYPPRGIGSIDAALPGEDLDPSCRTLGPQVDTILDLIRFFARPAAPECQLGKKALALILLLAVDFGIDITNEIQTLGTIAVLDGESHPIQRETNAAPGTIEGFFKQHRAGPVRRARQFRAILSLLGGSASVLLFENPLAATAGASGAVFGLLGAQAVILLRLKRSPTPVLIVIALNIFISISIPSISLWGHMGGLVAGAAATAGLVFLPNRNGAQPRAGISLAWLSVAAVALIALGTIAVRVLDLRAQMGL